MRDLYEKLEADQIEKYQGKTIEFNSLDTSTDAPGRRRAVVSYVEFDYSGTGGKGPKMIVRFILPDKSTGFISWYVTNEPAPRNLIVMDTESPTTFTRLYNLGTEVASHKAASSEFHRTKRLLASRVQDVAKQVWATEKGFTLKGLDRIVDFEWGLAEDGIVRCRFYYYDEMEIAEFPESHLLNDDWIDAANREAEKKKKALQITNLGIKKEQLKWELSQLEKTIGALQA